MGYTFYSIERKGRKYWVSKIPCRKCGKVRLVLKDNALKKNWTGLCMVCNSRENIPKLKRGLLNPNWRGGRIKMNNGYIKVWLDEKDPFYPMAHVDGYILEHRYLMAKKLGRCLGEFEQVHHLNGDRIDNRLENLELLDGSVHCLVSRMQKRIKFLEQELKKHGHS